MTRVCQEAKKVRQEEETRVRNEMRRLWDLEDGRKKEGIQTKEEERCRERGPLRRRLTRRKFEPGWGEEERNREWGVFVYCDRDRWTLTAGTFSGSQVNEGGGAGRGGGMGVKRETRTKGGGGGAPRLNASSHMTAIPSVHFLFGEVARCGWSQWLDPLCSLRHVFTWVCI